MPRLESLPLALLPVLRHRLRKRQREVGLGREGKRQKKNERKLKYYIKKVFQYLMFFLIRSSKVSICSFEKPESEKRIFPFLLIKNIDG